jgi:hypothetical protein
LLLVPRKRSTIDGSATRARGDHSAMNAVGSRSISVVCSLTGQDVANWRIVPLAEKCPPGLSVPPSLQYW